MQKYFKAIFITFILPKISNGKYIHLKIVNIVMCDFFHIT